MFTVVYIHSTVSLIACSICFSPIQNMCLFSICLFIDFSNALSFAFFVSCLTKNSRYTYNGDFHIWKVQNESLTTKPVKIKRFFFFSNSWHSIIKWNSNNNINTKNVTFQKINFNLFVAVVTPVSSSLATNYCHSFILILNSNNYNL